MLIRPIHRCPLALRFMKGSIHPVIFLPVTLHALFTAIVVYFDKLYYYEKGGSLSLPASIVPSLSIVVGLMLVFRNQTSYQRYWDGRNSLTTVVTTVRNLTRAFLVNAPDCHGSAARAGDLMDSSESSNETLIDPDSANTEMTVRVLVGIMYAIKHALRSEWCAAYAPPGSKLDGNHDGWHTAHTFTPEYEDLLPAGLRGLEESGVGLPVQLTFFVERYIRQGLDKGWFAAPLASGLTAQLNTLMDAYSRMEMVRMTPIPVAYLIHMKQVLALFCGILPFAVVESLGWLSILMVTVVAFFLYGIEGIGIQLEDPFGLDKNDIRMDSIVEDARQEVMTLLGEWSSYREMFAVSDNV